MKKHDLILSVLIYSLLVVLALGMAISVGLSHADDAFFANIARCLSDGYGYASPFDCNKDTASIRPFPPCNGLGPGLILPVAAAIALFGNVETVPALVAIGLWATLLGVIYFILVKSFKPELFFTTPLIFSALVLSTMGWHFEQWHSLLGEVHTAFLIILSCVIMTQCRCTNRNIFIAGIICGIAVQTKLLAVTALPGVILAFLFVHRPAFDKKWFLSAVILVAGISMPTLVFESWKLLELGVKEYASNWIEFLSFISRQGISEGYYPYRLLGALNTLSSRYSFNKLHLLAAAGMLTVPLIHRLKKPLYYLYISVFISFITSITYWIYFSVGWPRYAIMPLVMLLFLFSIIPFFLRMRYVILYTLLIIFLFAGSITNMSYPIGRADRGLFRPNTARLEREMVKQLLDGYAEQENIIIASQWWGSSVDVQFRLKEVIVVRRPMDVEDFADKDVVYLVFNSFVNPECEILMDYSSRGIYLHEGFYYQVFFRPAIIKSED